MRYASVRSYGRRARFTECSALTTGGAATKTRDAVCLVLYAEPKRVLVDMTIQEASRLVEALRVAIDEATSALGAEP